MGRKSQYDYRKWIITKAIDDLSILDPSRNPTIRDVADRSRIPVSSLHSYVKKLHAEGLVEWTEKTHRGLTLTPEGQRMSRMHNAQTEVPF